jgi:LPS-assembly lipoprotein
MIRIFSALILTLALSACGFHLRSAVALPSDLGPVRVVSHDPYSPLAQSLADALERAGASLAATDAGDDVATLQLHTERWGEMPIAVDQFGRAQEYSLRHAVVFELRKADGSVFVPQQAVELSRDYVSPTAELVGTEGEREILARELRREMAAAILRRIEAASRNPQPATPVESAVPADSAPPEAPAPATPPADETPPATPP